MGNVTVRPNKHHCETCNLYTRAMDNFTSIESMLFGPAPETSTPPTTRTVVSHHLHNAPETTTSTNVSTFRSLDTAGDVITEVVAGVLSGTAGVLATQPADTLKVKMQCFPERYKGVLDCLSQTVRRGGVRELYAGTLPSLVTEVAENALVFPLYCMSHTMLRWTMISAATSNAHRKNDADHGGNSKVRTFFDSLVSGAFAGGALSLLLAPAELVKCKLQSYQEAALTATHGKPSPWSISLSVPLASVSSTQPAVYQRATTYSVVRSVLALQGASGLFRGLSSTCLRELSGYSVFFASYELGTQMWYGAAAHDDLHLVGSTVFGAISGGLGWTVCLPFDVVKSRVQAGLAPPQFSAAFRHIVRREGLRALFLGYVPALIRVMPQNGIIMLVYETIRTVGRDYFKQHQDRDDD